MTTYTALRRAISAQIESNAWYAREGYGYAPITSEYHYLDSGDQCGFIDHFRTSGFEVNVSENVVSWQEKDDGSL